MTIAEAKQLRIVDYLASLGYHPQSVISKQYWYLSPLRDERTPSFKVNDRLNEWYDFGAATGGDLVELGKYLYRTNSVSEVLACIGRHENAAPIQRVRIPGTTPRPVEADMKDVLVVPLQHHALLSYLHSRGIDGDIGRMFCREVHYELRKRGATSLLPSATRRAGTRCAILIIRAVSGVRTSLSSGNLMVKHRTVFACSRASWIFSLT